MKKDHNKTFLQWATIRKHQPIKLLNAKCFKHFNELTSQLNGKLVYFEYIDLQGNEKYLSFSEGNPIFQCFKVVPQKFYMTDFNNLDYWKSYKQIDSNIFQTLLNMDPRKYKIKQTPTPILPEDYILFPLQTAVYQIDLISDICRWAKDNKRHVVFKDHPVPTYNSVFSDISDKIPTSSYITHIKHDVNLYDLISNSKEIWTESSGVGFLATLLNKKVKYFRNTQDVAYAPIAKLCGNVEEAASDYDLSFEDIQQYMSWYYHKFAIDVYNETHQKRLEDLYINYFENDYTIEDLYA